jgi:hypothetical protein
MYNKEYDFTASDGWIIKFMKSHYLSSQLVSEHSQSEPKKKQDQSQKIIDYLKRYHEFVDQQGIEYVYNFDETSFVNSSGMRTVALKRTHHKKKTSVDDTSTPTRINQPKIKNSVNSNRRTSIGCVITQLGGRLPPIINVKGKTDECLRKFKVTKNCLLTCTETSWFRTDTVLKVLDLIHNHSHGQKSLCILDSYKPHKHPDVLKKATELNIELLEVPHGLTSRYQPLDYNFNGVFKSIMKSHWFNNRYNEECEDTCKHITETIIKSYYSVPLNSIISSFDCMTL